ncbi:uncharacterized protein UV8b_06596 [Ustilaginoidea virens]|uniref:Thioredoxin-like fold protein n=1 Tax=Ustilaginoidea virens TaxID=1159556 RepID=A0A063C945_USTVR|nr:uncharacterized protein UV8b_06596 [Ustilaginoidea virens]QUC22355.1 hypothetical protein UV8b_06596 [Ustilaginoidea virens]GAO19504.1 hypothetical protein UVI_02054310 [Ustilaginoidea virens]
MTTFSTDPALYIFTSLTAGSSHIVTATSRLETILRANRVPFKAVDIATDQKARMLWGRRAGKDEGGRLRKLPGLVQEGVVLGDLVEIEEWNEYRELKQHVKIYYDEHTIPSIHDIPPEPPKLHKPADKSAAAKSAATAPPAPPLPVAKSTAAPTSKASDKTPETGDPTVLPLRSVADEAAQKAKDLRLKALRDKVDGKGTKTESESSSSNKTTLPGQGNDEEKSKANKDDPRPGMQSPTSAAWKKQSEQGVTREMEQSPSSGKWRSGSEGETVTPKSSVTQPAIKKETVEVEVEQRMQKEKGSDKLEEKNQRRIGKVKDDEEDDGDGEEADESDESEDDEDDEDDEEEDDEEEDHEADEAAKVSKNKCTVEQQTKEVALGTDGQKLNKSSAK